MRPKDLVYPFHDENDKKIKFEDRVLYMPNLECQFSFAGFHEESYFGNNAPIYVEYCSGNGAWISEKAKTCPEINWVGVEIKFKRIKKIWSKIKNHNLSNLIALYGEALASTKKLIEKESVSHVFINFPDPWPKKRHTKNRLMQACFIEELYRILKPEACFTFVTDDEDYSEYTINNVLAHSGFSSVYGEPFYISNPENYGSSYFDSLWREKGKNIRLHTFQKKG